MVAFPHAGKSRGPSCNLPLELTSFIGREKEIVEVKRLLTETRLLTLIGPGGCGKTRLALRVAGDLVEEFEDGVWLVELASLADPALVPEAVASALEVREAPSRSLTEMLVEHLKPKKTLLALDNCEHLIDACARFADTMLSSCPRLQILATSREALGVAGEASWRVLPLSLPEAGLLPSVEDLTRYETVRLFVERARFRSASFELTLANAESVVEICRKLEGIPLAIELAAARVTALTAEQISERIEAPLNLLTAGGRTTALRHQTLRATLEWSYELLFAKEEALFRRLSVFSGGFTLEAAEAVCAGNGVEKDEVLDLISHLVDKSLVFVSHGDEARYHMLETVREYGREKLESSGEESEVRRRHAGFFLELAEEAEPAMLGPEQAAWLGRLEREHDNLRAALGWLREEEAVERGLRLAGALRQFWWFRGYYTEGKARLEEFLGLQGASARTAARAKALYALGVLIYWSADYSARDQEVAGSRLEESLKIYRELGDVPRTSAVLRDLGRLGYEVGDWEMGRSFLEESLMLERRLGNEYGIGATRSLLGLLALFRGEHESARAHLEESLGILRRSGGTDEIKRCLLFLGCLACDQGEYAEARARFAEMMEGNPLRQYRWPAPFTLLGYARLAAGEGHPKRALRLGGAAAALLQTSGTSIGPAYQAYLRRGLESAWQALSEEEAKAAFEEGRMITLEEAVAYALDETSVLPMAGAAEAEARPELLSIFALGPVRVKRGERELTSDDWTYAKPRELLYYFLSHPPRSREQIGLALWPEASPAQLRRTFHTTLHHLRRALGGPEWIFFEKGRYAFNRSLDYFFDVEAFEKELAEAQRLKTEAPEQAISHLKEAIDLYKGDFLEGFADGEWALVRQEELRRGYGEALLSLGGLLFEEGRHTEAVEVYRKAIARDSYLEAAYRGLMRCLAQQGERGRALRHYEALVELLNEELGSPPAPETTELFERLRRGEAV